MASETGLNGLKTGRHGRRATVNRVEAIGVHVIREAARAADAGDDDKIFLLDSKFRENGLHGGENRVVTAAGAPAHFLVGLKILFCERWWQRRCAHGRFS